MVGVAFVGAGMVAELHQRALPAVEGASLVGVYDLDRDRREKRAADWGVSAYATLDEVFLDDLVDAVYVLSPPETHVPIGLRCLENGRHVLVEKPVSAVPEEIDELIAAARGSGLVAMPGHNYAYVPEFRRIVKLVEGGDLGTIRALWVTYAIAHPESVAASYGGVLEEVMVHHSYLTLALLGVPEHVHAGMAEPAWAEHQAEDQAWMTWEYPGGVSAHLFASFAVDDDSSDPWTFVVKVLGTRGSASLTWRSSLFRRALGTLSVGIPAYEESYEHEADAFRSAITRGTTPLSTLEDAAASARIVGAAYESARLRAAVDFRAWSAKRDTDRA